MGLNYNFPLENGKSSELDAICRPQQTKHDSVSALTGLHTQLNQTRPLENRGSVTFEVGLSSRAWLRVTADPGEG